ncbi:hypothetical protein ACFLQ1_02315, partial [Candidatus Auribacterota bacterium]
MLEPIKTNKRILTDRTLKINTTPDLWIVAGVSFILLISPIKHSFFWALGTGGSLWFIFYLIGVKYPQGHLWYLLKHLYYHFFNKKALLVSSFDGEHSREELPFSINEAETDKDSSERLDKDDEYEMYNLHSLQDDLPYKDIWEVELSSGQKLAVLEHWDDSLSCSFSLGGIDLGGLGGVEELAGLREALQIFLENRSSDYHYEIWRSVCSNYNLEIAEYAKTPEQNPVLKQLYPFHNLRVETYKKAASDRLIKKVSIIFTIQYHPQYENSLDKDFVGEFVKKFTLNKSKIASRIKRKTQENVDKLIREALSIVDTFPTKNYFLLEPLDGKRLLFALYEYFNKETSQKSNIEPPEFFDYQDYKQSLTTEYKRRTEEIEKSFKLGMLDCLEKEKAIAEVNAKIEFRQTRNLSVLNMICNSDIDRSENDCIFMDGYYHKFVTYTQHARHSLFAELCTEVFIQNFNDYDVIMKFWQLDTEREVRNLEWRSTLKEMLSKKSNGRWNKRAVQELKDMEELSQKLQVTDAKMYKVCLLIRVSGQNKEEVNENIKTIIEKFKSVGGCKAKEDLAGAYDVFIDHVPLYVKPTPRALKVDGEQLADMLPLYKTFNGFGKPYLFFKNINDELVPYNPLQAQVPHKLISGKSGMGKSFNISNILAHIFCKHSDTRLTIVDKSGAYEGIVKILGGNMINFWGKAQGRRSFVLNPFHLNNPEEFLSRYNYIYSLLEIMWANEKIKGTVRFNDLEGSVVDTVLKFICKRWMKRYNANKKTLRPTLTDFYYVLTNKNLLHQLLKQNGADPEFYRIIIERLKAKVKKWVGRNTELGWFFDGQSTVNLFADTTQ